MDIKQLILDGKYEEAADAINKLREENIEKLLELADDCIADENITELTWSEVMDIATSKFKESNP